MMIEKFPATKETFNFKDIYKLINEIFQNLSELEAQHPYSRLLSSGLKCAKEKIEIAKNRLAAESFIDHQFIEEEIRRIKEVDPQTNTFVVLISKSSEYPNYTFKPYKIAVQGR